MRLNLNKIFVILPYLAMVAFFLFFMNYCNRQEKERAQEKTNHNFELTKKRNELNQEITRANIYKSSLSALRKDSSKQLGRIQAIEKEYKRKLQAATTLTIQAHESASGKPTVTPGDTVIKNHIAYVYPTYTDTINRKFSRYRIYMSKDSSNIIADMIIPVDIASIKAGPRKNILSSRSLVMEVKLINPATELSSFVNFVKEQPRQYIGLKILGSFIGGAAAVKMAPKLFK